MCLKCFRQGGVLITLMTAEVFNQKDLENTGEAIGVFGILLAVQI